jgi:acetolactate synthase-1/2/3 large subunit
MLMPDPPRTICPLKWLLHDAYHRKYLGSIEDLLALSLDPEMEVVEPLHAIVDRRPGGRAVSLLVPRAAPGLRIMSPPLAATVAAGLRHAGVELLFGVPGGGSNLDVIGAAEAAGLRFVLAHTEGAAVLMAAACAELTGRPGACVVTRGPGAASAVNGVAHALLDRQPLLLISDCVPSAQRDRVSHQRLDHAALFRPVTKGSLVLGPATEADDVRAVLALTLAGVPGPVHVDLDATASGVTIDAMAPSAAAVPGGLTAVRDLLRGARRPVVVAGLGAVRAGDDRSGAELRHLVEGTTVPVLTTYKAKGAVPERGPNAAGLATGATLEAPLLAEADLILGVGLDPVELIPAPWPYPAPVVLLGRWPVADSTYFGRRLVVDVVVPDLGAALAELSTDVQSDWEEGTAQRARQAALGRVRDAVPPEPRGVVPQSVVATTRAAAPAGTIATVDAGAHMLPTLPIWEVDGPRELLISNGLATMGFALPAAVAAALVHPDRRVVCFTGDGGLGMVLAELETLARLWLDVVVVVFDDQLLSLIAIKQGEGQGGETAVHYAEVDFAAAAEALGVPAHRADNPEELHDALIKAMARRGPALVDVAVEPAGYAALLDAIRGGPSEDGAAER